MNLTASQIVESATWTAMIDALTQSYFARFIATPTTDAAALLRLREQVDALRDVDRELHELAREGDHKPRG